ncbi:MAG: glycosyltransferase family 9 protein [Candidatus Omnitrophica bacterium]|nr:glycosyltransferase family 9 protein [Candidatus Omnitrophota bacterium]
MTIADDHSRHPRLLIVNPFGIGDVLFSTPLVRAIRQAFPRAYLAYLCNRRTERILHRNPHLDELFVYEKDELMQFCRTAPIRCLWQLSGLIRRIWRRRLDLVIDLSLGERYSFLLALLRVPRRIGFNYRNRGRFLTHALAIDGYHEGHVVEYYRRLLHGFGIRLLDGSLELPVAGEDQRWAQRWLEEHRLLGRERLLVGILPAGGVSWGVDAAFRRWSFKGFAAVGDALVERYGAQIILFGEASDTAVCRTVTHLMRQPTIDVSGHTTLGQFVSLLSHLSLVLCNDGGPLHLAVSQGVKTVSVFGPVDPDVYGPYPPASSSHQVVVHEGLPCRPCYHHFKLPPCPYERACLMTIEPDEVIAACAALLDGERHGEATTAE